MRSTERTTLAALLAATALSATLAAPAFAGGILRLDEVPVGELDPAKASDYADSILMFNTYDTLVMPAQGSPEVVPGLAESWTAEGAEYTFTLKDGISFQSGNPLTAADVVFSFDRMKALGQGLSYLFGAVESAEAIDDKTVKFTLSSSYAPFINALIRLPIIDKTLVMANLGEGDDDGEMGDWGQAFLSGNSAGTGAYEVVSHNPQQETVLKPNPDYYLGIPDAAPSEVHLRYGLEAATVRAQIVKGEDDISSQWLPPEVLKALDGQGAQLFHEAGGGEHFIKLNTAKAPLDDVNCRLALANAFDYETAIKMIAVTDEVSLGTAATGAIPVGMLGSRPSDMAFTRDLDKAKEYLDACKYDPSEFTLELSWIAEVPLEERFALLMQSNFAEIGINSEIVKVPWALYTDMVTKVDSTPNVSQVIVTTVTGDPDTLIYGMYHSIETATWQSPEHLANDEVDALLDAGRTETDPAKRAEIYSELNDLLISLAPTIYAYDNQAVFAASNRVTAPALMDEDAAFGIPAMGFTFRQMEVAE